MKTIVDLRFLVSESPLGLIWFPRSIGAGLAAAQDRPHA